jgi:hypothetical protein
MHPVKLSRVLDSMHVENCTPSDFVLALLASNIDNHKPGKDSLLDEVSHIFNTFSIVPAAVPAIWTWAHEASKNMYIEQIQKLTNPMLGFHFNALNVTAEQIEAFSMGKNG